MTGQPTASAGAAPAPPWSHGEALVNVAALSKTFHRGGRRTVALSSVDLTVHRREFVCLLGPSGCGKSTLLNILAGILPYEEGTVEVGGNRVSGPGAERGLMFQSPMLFPWLTTRENVAFGPQAQKRGRRKDPAIAEEVSSVLETVGLGGFEDAYPKELSGGMRHRAAFARALVSRPTVLLMDEPFGALDALTRAQMQAFLLDMWAQFALTIVFVTHDIEEAILLGDRVCVMGGRPAGIVSDVRIELGRPRSEDDLETSEFLAIKRNLRRMLTGPDAGRRRRADAPEGSMT